MIESINDSYRKKIKELKTFNNFYKYYHSLKGKQKEFIFRLMLSDLYKILYIRKFNGEKDISLDIFNYNIEDIVTLCLDDDEILRSMFEFSLVFQDLDLLSKIVIFDFITLIKKDNRVFKINKFHVLDKLVYEFDYDLNFIKKIILDFVIKNYGNDFDKACDFICKKIKDLIKIDNKKYRKFIDLFIENFNKTITYKTEVDNEFLYEEDFFAYLYIKKFPKRRLYLKAKNNDDFLFSLVSNYLDYEIFEDEEYKEKVNRYFKKLK